MNDPQWPRKRPVQEPLSTGKRILTCVLVTVWVAPWVVSAVYWYPRLNPDMPFFDRVTLACGYWVLKTLAVLAIFVADRH